MINIDENVIITETPKDDSVEENVNQDNTPKLIS